MTHTPGPWNTTASLGIIRSNGQSVARTESDSWATHEEEVANARLIAAAPELLTVAQIAYTILAAIRHQRPGRHTAQGQGALCALRDAIVKATGRDAQDVQDE